jgi:hypothetical protein
VKWGLVGGMVTIVVAIVVEVHMGTFCVFNESMARLMVMTSAAVKLAVGPYFGKSRSTLRGIVSSISKGVNL